MKDIKIDSAAHAEFIDRVALLQLPPVAAGYGEWAELPAQYLAMQPRIKIHVVRGASLLACSLFAGGQQDTALRQDQRGVDKGML
jgi:hypothetical protein